MTNTPENNKHAIELLNEMCIEHGIDPEDIGGEGYDYIDKD